MPFVSMLAVSLGCAIGPADVDHATHIAHATEVTRVTEVADAPDHPRCYTDELWRHRNAGVPVPTGGGCPQQGNCDIPGVRDSYTPSPDDPLTVIRLHFHIVREDDGSNPAATEQDIIDQVETFNTDMAPWRIGFVYTWSFIDDSAYRNIGFNFQVMNALKNTYNVTPDQKCNIYVTGFPGGIGTFPWDPNALGPLGGVIMGAQYFGAGGRLIHHEVGHNLGLWHTHHGVSEVQPCSACWESPSGFLNDVVGDFCADTPPTPVNNNCGPPGGEDGCTGQPWGDTDFTNIMGYGGPECWQAFTGQQASRMNCWIDAELTPWIEATSIPGDLNGDGTVDAADLAILLAAWGTCTDCDADLNGDGEVGAADLAILLANWG